MFPLVSNADMTSSINLCQKMGLILHCLSIFFSYFGQVAKVRIRTLGTGMHKSGHESWVLCGCFVVTKNNTADFLVIESSILIKISICYGVLR